MKSILFDCNTCNSIIDFSHEYIICPNGKYYCSWNCRELNDIKRGATENPGDDWLNDRIYLSNFKDETLG